MPQRTNRGSTYGPSSAVSTNNDVINGIRRLNIGSSSKSPAHDAIIEEEGFTTVQRSKPVKAAARSMKIDSAATPVAGSSTFSPPNGLSARPGVPSAAAVSRASAYTSKDWRAPTGPNFNRTNQSDPRTKRHSEMEMVLPASFYRPGLIIRAPLHEQDYMTANSTVTIPDNKSITPSEFGLIHTKYRKMIVVACFARHYIAVPLFTHNGRGLVNKKTNEYVSIRDHRNKSRSFRALSQYKPLTTEHMNDETNILDVLTTAHITYPHSKHYSCKVVHEGHLDTGSINHLVALFNTFAPKAIPMA
ncbi:MAG: hypothetical protein Q9195_000146 [Heterodermia aff. obscurata]